MRCRQTDFPLDGVLFGGIYTEGSMIGKMIRALKYDHCLEIVPYVGDVMVSCIPRSYFSETSVLVPIPLAGKKLLSRGFNQAVVLADYVGEKLVFSVFRDFLMRLDNDRGSQTEALDRASRFEQIKSMFYIRSGHNLPLNTRCIILVDDVYTTGATLCEAGRTVKQRFPDVQVWGLVAARTM